VEDIISLGGEPNKEANFRGPKEREKKKARRSQANRTNTKFLGLTKIIRGDAIINLVLDMSLGENQRQNDHERFFYKDSAPLSPPLAL
jgi:hypothetical protein